MPVAFSHWWRGRLLHAGSEERLQGALKTMQPVSLIALLATLVLLFGFQVVGIVNCTKGWYEGGSVIA